MKNDDLIKDGDIVRVNFNNAQVTLVRYGQVIHVPVATGDSWVIKDNDKNIVHYISEPCTITKELPPSN